MRPVAERHPIDDLPRWTYQLKEATEGIKRSVANAVKADARTLLSYGLRYAPKHTGALRRSLRVMARRVTPEVVQLALQSDDPAAGVQETGGIIRARGNRMTVPIGSERAYWDRSGTRREPSQIAGLFKIRAKNGREYLVTRNGRELVLRFALRETVRMPAQRWATKAIDAALPSLSTHTLARMERDLLATTVRR